MKSFHSCFCTKTRKFASEPKSKTDFSAIPRILITRDDNSSEFEGIRNAGVVRGVYRQTNLIENDC